MKAVTGQKPENWGLHGQMTEMTTFSFYRQKKHSKLDIHIFYRKKPKKTVILVTGYGKARKTGDYPMTVCVTEMTVLRQV